MKKLAWILAAIAALSLIVFLDVRYGSQRQNEAHRRHLGQCLENNFDFYEEYFYEYFTERGIIYDDFDRLIKESVDYAHDFYFPSEVYNIKEIAYDAVDNGYYNELIEEICEYLDRR